ncbi:hypothetical protein [Tautonia plasticadhaerens]|uniref:Uncharacterized protein n=1 Tax=Tautonia plasticadhaerens TaxID=2527974 RepID=A0A518HE51_9BACT|nr:hypothetical protein [Tautonia plasticadhaerens]QDV39112.1 hypothetical protein ElP_70760 [Tautonia plasticadhaerens]
MPTLDEVRAEWARLEALLAAGFQPRALVHGDGEAVRNFFGPEAAWQFVELIGIRSTLVLPEAASSDRREGFSPQERQRRQVRVLEDYVQRLLRGADQTRDGFFLEHTTLIRTLAPRSERFRMFRLPEQSAEVFAREVAPFKEVLAAEVLGRIDDPVLPPDPRSRRVYDTPTWSG